LTTNELILYLDFVETLEYDATHCSCCFFSLTIFHKNLLDLFIFRPRRTIIRIRFQRWKASSFGHNVSKGSRQNGTVTLGKGVAQRTSDTRREPGGRELGGECGFFLSLAARLGRGKARVFSLS